MSTISAIIPYRDLPAAIDFLCDAFGFERHELHEEGNGWYFGTYRPLA